MFDKLLRLSLMLVLILLFMFLVGSSGAIRMKAVLERLLAFLLFGLIVEMRRGDESNNLFERVFGIFPDEEVYEGGYTTEKTLKVAYDQGRSEFGRRGTVTGFEWRGY